MNGSVLNGNHFEAWLCFMSHEFQTVGFRSKVPYTEGGGGNCICCNNFDLKNKNVNYRK